MEQSQTLRIVNGVNTAREWKTRGCGGWQPRPKTTSQHGMVGRI